VLALLIIGRETSGEEGACAEGKASDSGPVAKAAVVCLRQNQRGSFGPPPIDKLLVRKSQPFMTATAVVGRCY
jgi:hypothetical protein